MRVGMQISRALGTALYTIEEEKVIVSLPEGLAVGWLIGTWVKGPDAGKALVDLGARCYRSFSVKSLLLIKPRRAELH